jgi:hypothetical protein
MLEVEYSMNGTGVWVMSRWLADQIMEALDGKGGSGRNKERNFDLAWHDKL